MPNWHYLIPLVNIQNLNSYSCYTLHLFIFTLLSCMKSLFKKKNYLQLLSKNVEIKLSL